MLDEAANICPIKDLPDLYSYFGSMSLQVITILATGGQKVTATDSARSWCGEMHATLAD